MNETKGAAEGLNKAHGFDTTKEVEMPMNPVIKTERLLLRPFCEEDASALTSIANEPHILKWMPDWESTPEDTKGLIRYFVSQLESASKDKVRVMFAVELNGGVIGMVGIGNKEEVDNEIEIAFFISEPFAGKGYTTEAAKAVSSWALTTLGMEYLMAIVETDNYPSQRVIEKCGFERLGTRWILNSGETEEKPFYYYRLCRRE